ncbi:MAG: leucyl aminopeptidase family protein, partial [Mollicutes bacterium PWAP]|nr:leucyl aminopeptidase family protein [Mollicutes bacterium PWAP]
IKGWLKMIKKLKITKSSWKLKLIFQDDKKIENLLEEKNQITEDLNSKTLYLFAGKKNIYSLKIAKNFLKIAISNRRNSIIDLETFESNKVKLVDIVKASVRINYDRKDLQFSLKSKTKKSKTTKVWFKSKEINSIFEEEVVKGEISLEVRKWQMSPPNILNSEVFAKEVKESFNGIENVKVTVLNRKQIEKRNMGLLIGVNSGSNCEARVVIVEYKGNPESKQKTALVGKGIIFDSGGYSLKPAKFSLGMKFDMSGAAVAAGAVKAIAKLESKSNFTAVLSITDNLIGHKAITTDVVLKAMNGKTVEINNTDAEGRLVMADANVLATEELNATRVVNIATLTGAMLAALGHTYTGVWATDDKDWKQIKNAGKKADELLWRMPIHEDFAKFIKGSEIADLRNTDYSGNAGSSSAFQFLTQFVNPKKSSHVHFDIAGTSEISMLAKSPLIRTLVELSKEIK